MKGPVGSVVVACKPRRGSGVKHPHRDAFERVDVTSGGTKKLGHFKSCTLSPMMVGPVLDWDGNKATRFENLWHPQLGHWDVERGEPTRAWHMWKSQGLSKPKGMRTPPEVASLKKKSRQANADWTPIGHWWDGHCLTYLQARRVIYVPVFARAVVLVPAFTFLKAQVDACVIA
jgi:hypothetical protein